MDALGKRDASDIMVFFCPRCSSDNYYNEGSSASCHVCGSEFYVLTDDEPYPADGRDVIYADDAGACSLADLWESAGRADQENPSVKSAQSADGL